MPKNSNTKQSHNACKPMLGTALLKNDCLRTPKYITDALGTFNLDPCAGENTNIATFNLWDGRGEDGLTAEWNGFVWCNPPFSQKEIWAKKMIDHNNGILILPERGSAPWFGPLAEKSGCYFVMGKKINFEGGSSSNNLGSILFPFGDLAVQRITQSGLPGHFVSVEWFRGRCA